MSPTEFLDRKFESGKPRHCWMCGLLLTRGTASVDHLQPKSRGGVDRGDNYKLACKPCNSGRGNQLIPKDVRLELKGRTKKKGRDLSALITAIKGTRV